MLIDQRNTIFISSSSTPHKCLLCEDFSNRENKFFGGKKKEKISLLSFGWLLFGCVKMCVRETAHSKRVRVRE